MTVEKKIKIFRNFIGHNKFTPDQIVYEDEKLRSVIIKIGGDHTMNYIFHKMLRMVAFMKDDITLDTDICSFSDDSTATRKKIYWELNPHLFNLGCYELTPWKLEYQKWGYDGEGGAYWVNDDGTETTGIYKKMGR